MNIAIVDDNEKDAGLLQEMLRKYASAGSLSIETSIFSSGEALMENYKPFFFSLIFLDIYMDRITGIEAAQQIRRSDKDTPLIFLTSSNEFRSEALHCHAYDYLEKPIRQEELWRVMDDILHCQTDTASQSLLFPDHQKVSGLPFSKVAMISTGAKNYLDIIDDENTCYKTRMTFSTVYDLLKNDERFLLIRRGVLLNMDYITSFANDVCYLKNGTPVPIRIRDGNRSRQIWENYIFNSIRRKTGSRRAAE